MQQYDQFATEIKQRATQLKEGEQLWIGLAGSPGSGKSTLADALLARLSDIMTVIPMDGYHYPLSYLDQMPDPQQAHARRGAPFTFDAKQFVLDLTEARNKGEGSFPSFDHGIKDPKPNAIKLSKTTKVVFVEGNYLLLNQSPWSELRNSVFNETWFLSVPLEECNRRVCNRHMLNGLSQQQAQRRVDQNDSLNAQLITEHSTQYADRIIKIANL